MQSYEEPPPPYPGVASNVVTSKGNYKGVPVYEVGSNDGPIYNQTTYAQNVQASPSFTPTAPMLIQARSIQVGSNPIQCICPNCRQPIITRVEHESGSFAWLMCLLLAVVGCIPCCIVPFCVGSCQDVTHTCPHCSNVIGRRKIL